MTSSKSVRKFLERVRPPIEATLDAILPPENESPQVLHQAMRYSVFAGGKRLRPSLCLAGFQTFREDWDSALPIAASIELIHTYSLIHDDLPAMDNDDFRRGRPSCHRQFGEDIAILAGDALLTLAFETVAGTLHMSADRLVGVTRMLGKSAGTVGGMIAGQVLDLEAGDSAVGPEMLESIHRAKTGALLAASVSVGAYLAEADGDQLEIAAEFGRKIGLAFQIVDDLLDETASFSTLGKTPGKDREQGKVTYPAVHGIPVSRRIVSEVTDEARASALRLGPSGSLLADFASHLEARVH